MTPKPTQFLTWSAIASTLALVLLIIIGLIANLGEYKAGQELFETIIDPEEYSKSLANSTPALRIVLFLDALFILCFVTAIGFAILGFAKRNPPIAWFCGIAIIIVMFLDYWENFILSQSMDLLALGNTISLDRILYQASISSAKWQLAAITLVAISFLLPNDNLVEKLLVWGTRLGLAIGVPIFILDVLELRESGVILIALTMISGFLLLAIVTWKHSVRD
ncbi:MAG: hypothetical protein GY761_22095 [Hyphomicrobiales bacterium]|nr:hypothetical protein [Hyphomicrobiales bacterium]